MLESGNAVWLRFGAGFDFNGLAAAELGYNRAIVRDLDGSIALQSNVGFATGVGGTLRARWAATRFRNFHLAVDVPVSLVSYTQGAPPHLLMSGTEPGVLMSTVFGRNFGVFYGAMLRIYYAESTYFVGPQARAGAAWGFGRFRLGFGVNASRMFVSYTPPMTLFSADLALSYGFGGRNGT